MAAKTKTIDDVIETAQTEYLLDVTAKNRDSFKGFLERQLKNHKEYDLNCRIGKSGVYPSFALLVDELLIFSYLTRKRKVKQHGRDQEGTYVDTDEKLKLLKARGPDVHSWDDQDLFCVYNRRKYGKKNYGLMRYVEIIDEIGRDQEVKRIWSREITYKADMAGRNISHIQTPRTRRGPDTYGKRGRDRYANKGRGR